MNSNLSVLIVPTESPGIWASHCLFYDLISQGESVEEAISAIIEELQLYFKVHDEEKKPIMAVQAPEEYWKRFQHVQEGRWVEFEKAKGYEREGHYALKISLPKPGE